MVMGSMCVEGGRGKCTEKAGKKPITNPDSGLVDRLMFCSWQQRSTVDSVLTDTSVKRTPKFGSCLCLFPLFDSL